MTPKILDGKTLANKIKSSIADTVKKIEGTPTLASILVGESPASKVYLEMQTKACTDVGFKKKNHILDKDASSTEVTDLVQKLNDNPNVHGILLHFPLPEQVNTQQLIETIDPKKDVDGLTPYNLGHIVAGEEMLQPATPKGIIRLLNEHKIKVKGKHVVIVNHSMIVGKPLALLMLNRNATVTVCHEFTQNLSAHTRKADILISAVGKPGLISKKMVKQGFIGIDAGISRTEQGIKGDMKTNVKEKASYITPMPGGVGPMTIASLLQNTLKAFNLQHST